MVIKDIKIIILNGGVASGKTTVSKLVVKKLKKGNIDAVFIDLDDAVERLNPEFEWNSDKDRLRDWLSARKTCAIKTINNLKAGKEVIMVGPFLTKEEISGYLRHINLKVNVFLFTLVIPLEVRLKRNNERKFSNPTEDLIMQQKTIDKLLPKVLGQKTTNLTSPKETAEKILEFIGKNKGRINLSGLR